MPTIQQIDLQPGDNEMRQLNTISTYRVIIRLPPSKQESPKFSYQISCTQLTTIYIICQNCKVYILLSEASFVSVLVYLGKQAYIALS